MKKKVVALILAVLTVAFVAACAQKQVAQPTGDIPQPGATSGQGQGGVPSELASQFSDARWNELGLDTEAQRREFLMESQKFQNQDIYFDFDVYTLTEEAKGILNAKVAFLKKFPKVDVTIEGHCDERGTNEYNLALGERRAGSVYLYLANAGITGSRLTSVSYGEERPLALGHDESSWAMNRRAHFVLR